MGSKIPPHFRNPASVILLIGVFWEEVNLFIKQNCKTLLFEVRRSVKTMSQDFIQQLMTAVGPTYSRIQDYAANVHSLLSIYIIGP